VHSSEVLDESFEWVPPYLRGEISDAVHRSILAGARPPLSFAGAGGYGIVLCDCTGRAYKVARGWPDAPYRYYSLLDEAAWFKFASGLPNLRQHVARVYGFDESVGVLVRECVVAVAERYSDWSGKRDRRLRQLYDRMVKEMRPFGFRSPEFKEDSFVYHASRGPVLVDAGFGARDLGWANARRARELLRGFRPRSPHEIEDVAHGLRMDAGDSIPSGVAHDLVARLEKYR